MNKKIIVTLTGFEETASSRFRLRQLSKGLSEKYEVIDANLGRSNFFNRVALYIAKRLNLPIRALMRTNSKYLDKADIIIAERRRFDVGELKETAALIFTADDKDYPSKRILNRFDKFYVSTPKIAQDIEELLPNKTILHSPTAVDLERFTPDPLKRSSMYFDIVWSGYAKNFRYFEVAEAAFIKILSKYENIRLRIISEKCPKLGGLKRFLLTKQIDWMEWNPHNEVHGIQLSHLGIMPLIDSEFEKRKAGFKLIQYMACGLPVVCSPVGYNNEILAKLRDGDRYSADNENEWFDKILYIYKNYGRCQNDWRKIVEKNYSIEHNLLTLNKLIDDI